MIEMEPMDCALDDPLAYEALLRFFPEPVDRHWLGDLLLESGFMCAAFETELRLSG